MDQIQWLRGDGTGSFRAAQNIAPEPGFDIDAGDLNNDGNADLVSYNVAGWFTVVLSEGDGAFAEPTVYRVGTRSGSVTLADTNADGNLDVVVASTGVDVLLGDGTGALRRAPHFGSDDQFLTSATGDFDGDGDVDIAATAPEDAVVVYPGTGNGRFGLPHAYYVGDAYDVVTADFDEDGDLDLATANVDILGTSVLLNRGDGTFEIQRYPVSEFGAFTLVAEDFDRDGDIDFAFGGTTLLAGDGTGSFGPPVDLGVPGDSIASGDLDSDGDEDLVVTGEFSAASVLLNLAVRPGGCTMTGTAGNDLLTGTPRDDVICGLAWLLGGLMTIHN